MKRALAVLAAILVCCMADAAFAWKKPPFANVDKDKDGFIVYEEIVVFNSGLTLEAMRRMLLLQDTELDRVRLPAAVRRELFSLLEGYCAAVLERENKPLSALRSLLKG